MRLASESAPFPHQPVWGQLFASVLLLAGLTIHWTNAPLVTQQWRGEIYSPFPVTGLWRIDFGHAGWPPWRNAWFNWTSLHSHLTPRHPLELQRHLHVGFATMSHRACGVSLGLSLLRSHHAGSARGSPLSLTSQGAGMEGKLGAQEREA